MDWYRQNGRHTLPWRLTRDPYAVLVSEVMLQQTQVERVLPYYRQWLERWPTFTSLAAESPAEVIRAWRGLGYNRRALNLHRLAVEVAHRYGGELPRAERDLRSLPGIGEYTAAAVRSFAFEEPVAVADTNIGRVVARAVLGAASQRDVATAQMTAALAALLPNRDVRAHNLALMDLGATVCSARQPRCEACPLAQRCGWRQAGMPPAAAIRTTSPRFESTARFARGRIIDALRVAPATAAELQAALPSAHHGRLDSYLQGLRKDGLISEQDGRWQLPS